MKLSLVLAAVVALVAAAPAEEFGRAVCPCEPVFCVQSFPASCYCANNAARVCYETCGGAKPTYGDCNVTTTVVRATPEPYPRCGSRGLPACAEGTICVDDPTSDRTCGQACDIPGYCVPDDVTCGGFIGQECPVEGQYCAKDPRDECAAAGGADCIGLCFTPQV